MLQFDFYICHDITGLNLKPVDLFTPQLNELHGQRDDNIPHVLCFLRRNSGLC